MQMIGSTPQFRAAALPAMAGATSDEAPQASSRIDMKGTECPGLTGCQKQRSSNPNEQFEVSVILKNPKAMPAPGSKPMSAADHKQYESTPSQMSDIEKFAKANGLSIASADPATRTVKLSGTAANYQKAFGVQLNTYKDAKGGQFRAYEGAISLPKNMAGNVEGVLGLYNRQIAQPRSTPFHAKPADVPANGYTPTQLGQLYNFPQGLDGTGQTISIIELGGGYNETDMQAYFKKLGIAEPNIKAVAVDGGANTPAGDPNSADGEVALDIEVAGAIAPKANINVYFAPNSEQGFVDAVNQAAHDNPKNNTISISWGSAEDNTGLWTPAALTAFDGVLHDAANLGVNTYVASGDNGSDDGVGDGKNHVDFPSASNWDISTGGTKLVTDANGAKASEVAWGEQAQGNGAAGGGVSNIFGLPDYQKGAGVPAPTTAGQGGRGVPDVAGDAAPDSGYDVIVDGSEGAIGGTSAVAPLYAGLTALLGQGAGGNLPFLNPVFYAHPDAFNDITSGTNGAFNAGPGWDAITGLGSPDGTKLLAALKAAKAQG